MRGNRGIQRWDVVLRILATIVVAALLGLAGGVAVDVWGGPPTSSADASIRAW